MASQAFFYGDQTCFCSIKKLVKKINRITDPVVPFLHDNIKKVLSITLLCVVTTGNLYFAILKENCQTWYLVWTESYDFSIYQSSYGLKLTMVYS